MSMRERSSSKVREGRMRMAYQRAGLLMKVCPTASASQVRPSAESVTGSATASRGSAGGVAARNATTSDAGIPRRRAAKAQSEATAPEMSGAWGSVPSRRKGAKRCATALRNCTGVSMDCPRSKMYLRRGDTLRMAMLFSSGESSGRQSFVRRAIS